MVNKELGESNYFMAKIKQTVFKCFEVKLYVFFLTNRKKKYLSQQLK